MPKTDQLNVRVDPNIREALERVSLERQQPLSYVLRQLMMWFLHYYDRAPDRAMRLPSPGGTTVTNRIPPP